MVEFFSYSKIIVLPLFFSPSGCTFWGKKPWSRKKKILWQLGTLVGAPVGITLVAGIAIPAMIIGIPVWVGRKVSTVKPVYNNCKPVLNDHSQKDRKLVFKTNYRLMQVKSILQCFRPSLSYQLSLRSMYCLFFNCV